MKKNYIRKENGFATSDALIAVLVIVLFSGLIATLTYNIYLATTSTKRMSRANCYITDIFEYVDKSYYDDINAENITNYFNNKYYYQENTTTPREDAEVSMGKPEEKLTTPFKILLKIENHYPENTTEDEKLDLVKKITITVKYELGSREQEIKISRAKSRENLVTPNVPDLDLIEKTDEERVYPIKIINFTENVWKVCTDDNTSWYNYNKGEFPTVLITTSTLNIDDEVDVDDLKVWKWTPRYAINNVTNNIVYLYANTNKYIQKEDNYNKLFEIDENFTVPDIFTKNGNITGIWEQK